MHNFERPDTTLPVTTDIEIIESELTKHYQILFGGISGKSNMSLISNKILVFTAEMVKEALENLN